MTATNLKLSFLTYVPLTNQLHILKPRNPSLLRAGMSHLQQLLLQSKALLLPLSLCIVEFHLHVHMHVHIGGAGKC